MKKVYDETEYLKWEVFVSIWNLLGVLLWGVLSKWEDIVKTLSSTGSFFMPLQKNIGQVVRFFLNLNLLGGLLWCRFSRWKDYACNFITNDAIEKEYMLSGRILFQT